MNNPTERLMRLRDAAKRQTAKTRDTVARVAQQFGVPLDRQHRQPYHCLCPGEGETAKSCVEFACHQLADQQKSVVLNALRGEPTLFHAFSMEMWSDEQHEAILERVRAHTEASEPLKRLLEYPHRRGGSR
jgi:hypothetical protein